MSFSLFVHNFHWDVATRRPAWLVLRACKFALCHFLIPSPASTATSFYFHVINHTSVHLPVLCGDLLNDVTSLFCIAHFKECSMILSFPNQRFPIKSYCLKTWTTKCRWTVIISSSSSCLVSTPIYLHPIPTGISSCKVGQTIFIIISWFFLNRQSLNENPKK